MLTFNCIFYDLDLQVRSITLDTWEPELVKVMLELGNDVVNRCYEANVDETVANRATPTCDRSVQKVLAYAAMMPSVINSKEIMVNRARPTCSRWVQKVLGFVS